MVERRKRHAKKSKNNREKGSPRITVYVSPGCVACDILLEFLEMRDIPHRAKDIARDGGSRAELAMLNGGDLSVPVVRMRGKVLRNPKWTDLVAALGIGSLEYGDSGGRTISGLDR